jgi:hypothetical protein
MTGTVSPIEAAARAFGFLPHALPRAAGALAVVAILDTAEGLALASRHFSRAGIVAFAGILATVMARGALLRIGLAHRRAGDEDMPPGWAGFQWGRVEARLLAVTALRAFLFGLLAALLVTVLMSLYVGLAAAQPGAGGVASPERWRKTLDPVGWTVVSAAALAGGAGLAWVWLRVYLGFAATVALARVMLLSTWPLTRGHVWRLARAVVLASAPVLAIGLVLVASRSALGPAGCAVAAGVGHAFLALPLSAGLMSTVYDRLCPDPAGAA